MTNQEIDEEAIRRRAERDSIMSRIWTEPGLQASNDRRDLLAIIDAERKAVAAFAAEVQAARIIIEDLAEVPLVAAHIGEVRERAVKWMETYRRRRLR